MANNDSIEKSKDSITVPKAPARKKSSHNSVVQFKRSKFEADDSEKLNDSKLQPDFCLNKSNMPNNDIIRQKKVSKGDKDDYEDEGGDLNWRPLRDFF